MLQEKTIAFHTLGCKLNFAETSTLTRSLEKDGFKKVGFETGAEVYVINTCSVTENADKECRSIIRKALSFSPNAQVVVVGCYAQLKAEEIATIQGVDLVLGAKEKFRLAEYLNILPYKKKPGGRAEVYSCDVNDVSLFESSYSFGERTRAFLKIQDGCNYNCTYCTIPLARGRSRSDQISHVVDQAWLLSELGVKEIVLTGVNIGDFGIHNPRDGSHMETFFELIQKLDEVSGIERFRISSIEPNLLRDEIIEFVGASKRFMPHFHIPLQSGSDRILKLMKRRYLTPLYRERIERIKSIMPHCCIGADVITGFPGENENEFLATYNFLKEIDISYLHVFTYSERDDTEAIQLGEVVPKQERHLRNKMLRILSEKKRIAFYSRHLSSTRKVLFELTAAGEYSEGFTDNYIKVKTTHKNLKGKILEARLNEISFGAVTADLTGSLHEIVLTTKAASQALL